MRCRKCGAQVDAGLSMCPRCGATVRRVRATARKLRCRSCQRRVPSGVTICPYCGARLRRSWQRPLQVLLILALLAGVAYLAYTYVPQYSDQLLEWWAKLRGLPGRVQVPEVAFLATPTFSATPTATRTATLTRVPTATVTRTAIPPTETSLPPTETATRRPAPTRTATPFPSAPKLLSPDNGLEIHGSSAQVTLRWESVVSLAEGEWYALSLRFQAGGITQYSGTWTKETSYVVPEELYNKAGNTERVFQWDVTVMRQTGTKPDGGREGTAVSAPSETRSFTWH